MSLKIQRLFIPAVQVEVFGFVISNLDGNGLRMEWEINRDNTNKPDEGEIRIYNLAPKVAKQIHGRWQTLDTISLEARLTLTFSIGWDRIPKRLFVGDVWDMIPSKRTPTDVITVFKVGDGNRAQRDQVIGRDLHNIAIADALRIFIEPDPKADDIGGGGLGLIYPPESRTLVATAAAEVAKRQGSSLVFSNLPKGINTREFIDLAMETLGLEWRVHNGVFVVMRGGIINKLGLILMPKNGLIGYTEQNDGGINLTNYADSLIEPGIQIQVLNNFGKPVAELAYRVSRALFFGTTDEESLVDVTARKALI